MPATRLVDEVLIDVLPVLLGDSVRLSTSGLGRIVLEPLSNTQAGPVTMLRFPGTPSGLVLELTAGGRTAHEAQLIQSIQYLGAEGDGRPRSRAGSGDDGPRG